MDDLDAFATVLNKQGDALLGLRWDADFWGQPGGGVEPGETPWDAVVREVREETGIVARVERPRECPPVGCVALIDGRLALSGCDEC